MQGCENRVRVESESCQVFLGKRYFKCGAYFKLCEGTRKLHQDVWEFFSGEEVPEGYDIHHEDLDSSNNQYENLICVERSEHLSFHASRRIFEMSDEEFEFQCALWREGARRWHQSEEGLAWHKKHYQEVTKEALNRKYEFTCQQCGHEFEAGHGSKFCSNTCKSAWRRQNGIDDEYRTCAVCGGFFTANKYSKRATCSRQCRRWLSSESRKERATANREG